MTTPTETTTPAATNIPAAPPLESAPPVRAAGHPPAVRRSIVATMAEKYGMEPAAFEQTIFATVMPSGATREQCAAFLVVSDQYELNPFLMEIYAFPTKGGGIRPIVSVDGWMKLANRHPMFDGVEIIDIESESGELLAVEVVVHRKDRSHPTRTRETMKECKRDTPPWKQCERRMLRHKALIQGYRVAFGFAGIYEPDEGERIDDAIAAAKPVGPADKILAKMGAA